jgi:hypothetical protein
LDREVKDPSTKDLPAITIIITTRDSELAEPM